MFEHVALFNNVVISGPQRSDTRIAAKIVAADINKTFIDEKEINFHDFRLLEWYLQKNNVVIQCPALCHKLHEIKSPSTLIVIVRRPVEEILDSERRKWDEVSRLQELYKYGYSEGIISRIKYEYWDTVQKPILGDRAGEINFHELSTHQLYIDNRSEFKWDQTK